MAYKISSLPLLILAARPCAAGNAEYFSVSFTLIFSLTGRAAMDKLTNINVVDTS